MKNLAPAILFALCLGACNLPDYGAEGQRCFDNKTCLPGLTCGADNKCSKRNSGLPDDAGGAIDVGEPHSDVGHTDGASAPDSGTDSGADAAVTDSGVDVGLDASLPDVSADTGTEDAGTDAEVADAGIDVGLTDIGQDTGITDAGADTGEHDSGVKDAGDDAGLDAGCTPKCSVKCNGPDQCGGTCPDNCVSPQTCGGGGTQNECGCTPSCSGKCGGASNGCSGTCPDPCNGHGTCNAGTCTCSTGHAAPYCNSCAAGYSGYPNCVLIPCGDYGNPCCASDVCNGENVCNSGKCVSNTCTGKNDFTLCKSVTSPDRKYDICVSEVCYSPGCGVANCNPPGLHFQLPDTGQTKCYDNSSEMTCTSFPCSINGTPQFCGQDAQYGWDVTHQPADRFAVAEEIAGEPAVTDNVTGLVWQGCPAGQRWSDCRGTAVGKHWDEALAYCDSLTWGNQSDWRLPDRYELLSIIDFGGSTPTIDSTVFPGTPANYFWSSSSLASDSVHAWYAKLDYGSVDADAVDKTNALAVRCVRVGSVGDRPVKSEFVTGQPIVTYNRMGLVWQGCIAGQTGSTCLSGSALTKNWADALTYCESLGWNNQTDWRLPSVAELSSIVDDRRTNPSIDSDLFPATGAGEFWTSSSSFANDGWTVVFSEGQVTWRAKFLTLGVRCVRTGP